MIYWFTGQPGHGKTLHGITRALEYMDEGRLVYVCNVAEFDYAKTGCLPMTPEQFRNWMEFLPDGAVALVDEAYEHEMLPKRPPGSKVPEHVKQLAKHRHRGLDFIFISQSPAKQIDEFVHDLIERHVHVRRRWGINLVQLREFDYFERNPVKATPTVIKRVRLPKRAMGCYKSTSMDTTERRVPWYVMALAVGVPTVLGGAIYMVNDVEASITGEKTQPAAIAEKSEGGGENGAGATVEPPTAAPTGEELRQADFVAWLTPRIAGQPWTAPAYDQLSVPNQPPRIFCMASGWDGSESCTCKTEQGTDYKVELNRCVMIARQGQYEPFLDEVLGDRRRLDDATQLRRLREEEQRAAAANTPTPATSSLAADQVSHYGDLGVPLKPGA